MRFKSSQAEERTQKSPETDRGIGISEFGISEVPKTETGRLEVMGCEIPKGSGASIQRTRVTRSSHLRDSTLKS
jgi:hypothetical protein